MYVHTSLVVRMYVHTSLVVRMYVHTSLVVRVYVYILFGSTYVCICTVLRWYCRPSWLMYDYMRHSKDRCKGVRRNPHIWCMVT